MLSTLIIDDSETLRKRLRDSLFKVRNNLKINEAATGDEALKSFAAEKQETVILDISLPDISGIEILKKIKILQPETRVIIFTNYPTREFKERCLNLGADYFFDKCSDYRNILELFKNNFS